jgi:hypothetical protein
MVEVQPNINSLLLTTTSTIHNTKIRSFRRVDGWMPIQIVSIGPLLNDELKMSAMSNDIVINVLLAITFSKVQVINVAIGTRQQSHLQNIFLCDSFVGMMCTIVPSLNDRGNIMLREHVVI